MIPLIPRVFILSCCLPFCSGSDVPPGKPNQMSILVPGEDVPVSMREWAAGKWLGLFSKNSDYYLDIVKVKFIQTEWGDSLTVVPELREQDRQSVTLLIRGLSQPAIGQSLNMAKLRKGSFPSAYLSPIIEGNHPWIHRFSFAGNNAFSLAYRPGKPDLRPNIVFSNGNKSQLICQLPFYDSEGGAELLWAGDLDEDGQVDLLISTAISYREKTIRLYLSSKATAPNLVRQVATYEVCFAKA